MMLRRFALLRSIVTLALCAALFMGRSVSLSHTFDLPDATESHDFELSSRPRWKTTQIWFLDRWPLVPTQSPLPLEEEGTEAEGMRCWVLMILRSPPALVTPSRRAKAGGIRSSSLQEMAHG